MLYTADACIIKNEDVLTVLIEVMSFSNCMAVKRRTGSLEGIKYGMGFFTFFIGRGNSEASKVVSLGKSCFIVSCALVKHTSERSG